MREQNIFEHAHPVALVLVNFKLANVFALIALQVAVINEKRVFFVNLSLSQIVIFIFLITSLHNFLQVWNDLKVSKNAFLLFFDLDETRLRTLQLILWISFANEGPPIPP